MPAQFRGRSIESHDLSGPSGFSRACWAHAPSSTLALGRFSSRRHPIVAVAVVPRSAVRPAQPLSHRAAVVEPEFDREDRLAMTADNPALPCSRVNRPSRPDRACGRTYGRERRNPSCSPLSGRMSVGPTPETERAPQPTLQATRSDLSPRTSASEPRATIGTTVRPAEVSP